jgi:amino acid transporter
MEMDLSFREKSLWLMLVALTAAFGFYFLTVLPPGAADVRPPEVIIFIVALVFLVILQIVGHILIAIVDRRTDTDERDRLIELKGTRNASYVLATGVFLALCAALMTDGNFVFTHVLLAFWVLAQLVEIGSQLVLHRRGA